MTKRIYVAGPLFNTHERWYLERIAEELELIGYKTFLPHRDAGIINDFSFQERAKLFYQDLSALDLSDYCVALLTGPDHDSGTCAELGYAYSKGKLCFGLTDDKRWLNNFIWGICNDGQGIFATIAELVGELKDHIK